MAELLGPYASVSEVLALKFCVYLDLLLRWNAKTNLTAVRSSREIIQTHFGESLFAARHLPEGVTSLLDFGSGAGFPGLPILMARPDLDVTLAESQGKKSAFLREAVRTLALPAKIYAGRVEDLPATAIFSAVTLRAVDKTAEVVPAAVRRIATGGWLIILTSAQQVEILRKLDPMLSWKSGISIPNSNQRILLSARKTEPTCEAQSSA
ncbi:MAG: 16S rRNA (guanine(527)-N(7))-methyltransferase RsmG [Acidobacteriaceae bacterium]